MNLIKQAKEYLILHHPFFAYLSLQINFEEDSSVAKSSIDGFTFRYNPEHIASFNVQECAAFIARAMASVLLLHPLRAEHKEVERFNKACAYAVNDIMKEAHIPILNEFYDPKFKNLSAEDIYEVLEDEEENESSRKTNNSDGTGNGEDNSDNSIPTGQDSSDSGDNEQQQVGDSDICEIKPPTEYEMSGQEQEQRMTQIIMDAAMQTEFCGTQLTQAITAVVNQLKEPKKDWREILLHFTAEIARNDYDWEKPDLQYLQRNIYIPSLHSIDIGGVVFAIDTSGSINEDLLTIFLSELKEAAEQMTKEIIVIHCDTEIREVEDVQSEDIDSITPKGRGGTRFSPVFEYIAENDLDPKALIYFTDGRCYETLTEPDYPVIWCIYENKNFKPQFGEAIFVDN